MTGPPMRHLHAAIFRLLGPDLWSAPRRTLRVALLPLVIGHWSLLISSTASAATVAVEEATITDLQNGYRSGTFTARSVVEAYLARIEAYDKSGPYINSIISLNPAALAEAEAQDAKLKATGQLVGPLHGITFLVKDNIDVEGQPMTSGFQGWKNYVSPTDAPAIARIKAAGGIILGKNSLSEFARGGADNVNSVLPGYARNPYRTEYATGGSSGGTGASIAANFATIGIGTDTGGSIRMPAAHQALVGLRPTIGLVSRTGVVPLYSYRDTAGPMARNVHDAALVLAIMSGDDPEDFETKAAAGHFPKSLTEGLNPRALQGARLGVFRQFFPPATTDPRILANFEKTIAELKAAGAVIIDPFTVPEFDKLPRPGPTPAQHKADMTRWISMHPGVPYPSVKAIADSKLLHPLHQVPTEIAAAAGPAENDAETLASLENDKKFLAAFTRAMDAEKIDAMILPVWTRLPVINGDRNTQPVAVPVPGGAGSASTTFLASILRWPALSVPNGYVASGIPVGMHMVGRAWEEKKIIGYAYAYEQATEYRVAPPTTPPLTESFASKFIGTWKLVAVRERDPATGTEVIAARPGIDGQLVYAPNGRLSVQIIREGREKVAAGSADGFSSYFGTWKLLPAEGCVVHEQEWNINQAQSGVPAKRYYSFNDLGHLSLATPVRKRDSDGKDFQMVFVWSRLP
jgi:amidase